MAVLTALFSFFFHIVVPGYIIFEIFRENNRRKIDILGYVDETKKHNIKALIITLIVYIIILAICHWIA